MTSTPGQSVSTMNAVIWSFDLPFTIFGGVRAMTTMTPAFVPLVHQSFSPLRMKKFPSGAGSACVAIAAGSEPTSVSVKANAEISPRATRGRYFLFCSSVPNKISGCGTPMDWCAEISAVVLPHQLPSSIAARQ